MGRRNLKQNLLWFDLFGENISFNIRGNSKHKSLVGMVVSLAILLTVTAFTIKQFNTMLYYEDTRHTRDLKIGALPEKEPI